MIIYFLMYDLNVFYDCLSVVQISLKSEILVDTYLGLPLGVFSFFSLAYMKSLTPFDIGIMFLFYSIYLWKLFPISLGRFL